jgi:phosphatidylinositol 4-phosphatase
LTLPEKLHSYILPIMQGHYQISTFPISREPVLSEEGDFVHVDYILVSRRSRSRAGLRHQRRGVDDSAHVANFVETETVMRVEVWFLILFATLMNLIWILL